MKKSLIMIPLAAMSCVALASCGKNEDYSIQEYIMANALESGSSAYTFTSFSEFTIPASEDVYEDDCFVYYRTGNACCLYSIATGKRFATKSKDCNVTLHNTHAQCAEIEDNGKKSFYDRYGNLLAEDTDTVTYTYSSELEYSFVNGSTMEVYVLTGSDGSVKKFVNEGEQLVNILDWKDNSDMYSLYCYGLRNYLEVMSESSKRIFSIVTPEEERLGSFSVTDSGCFAINYDSYIIQETTKLSDNAAKYDFMDEGEKYDLETYSISLKTGKKTELDWNYVFVGTRDIRTPEEYSTSVIHAYEIKNKKLSDDVGLYLVGKNAEILGNVTDTFDKLIYKVNDCYLYGDTLYTKEGKKVFECEGGGACKNYVIDTDNMKVFDSNGKSMFSEPVTGGRALGSDGTYNYYYFRIDGIERNYREEIANPGTLVQCSIGTAAANSYIGAGNFLVWDDDYVTICSLKGARTKICTADDSEWVTEGCWYENASCHLEFVRGYDSDMNQYHYYVYK